MPDPTLHSDSNFFFSVVLTLSFPVGALEEQILFLSSPPPPVLTAVIEQQALDGVYFTPGEDKWLF